MNVCAEMFGAPTRTRKGIPSREYLIMTSRSARSQLQFGACLRKFPGVGPVCSRCSRNLNALFAIFVPAGHGNLSFFSFKDSPLQLLSLPKLSSNCCSYSSLKPKLHATVRKRLRRPGLYSSRALLEQWKAPLLSPALQRD